MNGKRVSGLKVLYINSISFNSDKKDESQHSVTIETIDGKNRISINFYYGYLLKKAQMFFFMN